MYLLVRGGIMIRHSFEEKLCDDLGRIISRLDVNRLNQESHFVAGLFVLLHGYKYKHIDGRSVELLSTMVNDRGPKSAESKFGADFAITAVIHHEGNSVRKAVLGQAKKGSIKGLSTTDREKLDVQIEKMAAVTDNFLLLEAPKIFSDGISVWVSDLSSKGKFDKKMTLERYIVSMLIGCTHGDKRAAFVDAVQHGALKGLTVIANM
jgi:hypothetical protein